MSEESRKLKIKEREDTVPSPSIRMITLFLKKDDFLINGLQSPGIFYNYKGIAQNGE